MHDNTEKDVILVPASVLDCKLRDFESLTTARASLAQDVALVVAFFAPVVSGNLGSFLGLSGETIKGVFAALAVVMIIKTLYDATIVFAKWKFHNRAAVIRALHGHIDQDQSVFRLFRSLTPRLKRKDEQSSHRQDAT